MSGKKTWILVCVLTIFALLATQCAPQTVVVKETVEVVVKETVEVEVEKTVEVEVEKTVIVEKEIEPPAQVMNGHVDLGIVARQRKGLPVGPIQRVVEAIKE